MVAIVLHPDSRSGKQEARERTQLSSISDEQLKYIKKSIECELASRARRRLEHLPQQEAHGGDGIGYTPQFRHSSKRDSRLPRALPQQVLRRGPADFTKYIITLLNQDWSSLWPYGDEQRKYCVYAHIDPNSGCLNTPKSIGGQMRQPFYIGKGTVDRAFNLDRNQGHGIRLRQLLEAGSEKRQIVKILRNGLNEREAFELEAKLIYFFGTIYEKNRVGLLLNLDISRRPEFVGEMPKLLCQAAHAKMNGLLKKDAAA